MFNKPRFANIKIKEIYDCHKSEEINKFKARFASLINEADNNKLAKREVFAIEPHYVYVVVSGLHGDEANDNGDYFEWSELLRKKAYNRYTFETWVGKPVLENHDARQVRGMIIDAWPINNEKSIDFLLRVDERCNPNLVKGIRNGSVTGTSMGVMVGHSYCNICNNLAHDETEWCEHLSPSKLNIKGKLYTGQDGNKFPEKVGIICYEDNRDLEGVEDSFITLGEPADSKAHAKTVLATTEGNSEMPNNDRSAINSKRNEMLNNPRAGIRELDPSRVSIAAQSGEGNPGLPDRGALQRAVTDLLRKKGLAPNGMYATAEGAATYESSGEVVKAINEGTVSKREAITYVEKFRLVSADKVDDLSSSEAFDLLVKDSEDEKVHEEVLTKVASDSGDQAISEGDAKPEENQPTPDAGMTEDSGDQAISEGDAKPEEKQPTPDGTVSPASQTPSGKDSGDQAADTNKAKPEENQPAPDGTVSPASQTPSGKDSGDQAADTNKAKPEEGQPAPKTACEESGDQAISEGDAPVQDQPAPEEKSQVTNVQEPDNSDLAVSEGEAPTEEQPDPIKAQKEDELSEEDLEKMTPIEKVEEALEELQDAVKLIKDVKPDVPKEKPEDMDEAMEEAKEEDEEKDEEEKEDVAEEIKEDVEELPVEELPPLPAEEEIPEELPGEMPLFGYKVELVKDEKSPEDSYYVVSLKKNPIFQVTARQAWGRQAKEKLDEFTSNAYGEALTAGLNKSGAKEIFTKGFGSLGLVLAQEEILPEETFEAPAAEAPAAEMNVEEKPLEDIKEDDVEAQDFTDLILETLATVLAQSDGASPEEIVEELKTTFSSEELASEFSGILREKYEQKQKEKTIDETPEAYRGEGLGEELPPVEGIPGGELPAELPELREVAVKMKKKFGEVEKLLPEVKALLEAATKERDAYKSKYEQVLEKAKVKARVSYTKSLAARKVELGLLENKDVEKEAVRLAKLPEDGLKQEVASLENSIKIAQKITKKSDYINVEDDNKTNKREAIGNVIATIPSQVEEEAVQGKTFAWSRGFHGRKS